MLSEVKADCVRTQVGLGLFTDFTITDVAEPGELTPAGHHERGRPAVARALAGFVAASALCALAPDLGWLIALRVLQGLAAGLLVPAGQTILGQAVGPGRLGRVMAVLGIAVGFGPAFGPALGGMILSTAS